MNLQSYTAKYPVLLATYNSSRNESHRSSRRWPSKYVCMFTDTVSLRSTRSVLVASFFLFNMWSQPRIVGMLKDSSPFQTPADPGYLPGYNKYTLAGAMIASAQQLMLVYPASLMALPIQCDGSSIKYCLSMSCTFFLRQISRCQGVL